ncbi:hypothetical protein FB565_008357 [Actinoplanes lutulentus]|uniref:Uncharacterized protein n=2 Tax=Actinoplanes lutulentus TaxID=1287878 RepID=A0A327ZBB2_9ACTN|nr:hypothetical protein [Actinoplanes lutulentus]MBB2948574.1 hypothetical protein [Actinoplanes lutulentus]RAK36733.1 hypothetical protein B0I29_108323 [Actinoplanes lutulentus]
MVEARTVRTLVAVAGFLVQEFVEVPHLPSPMAAWKPFILASATPLMRISYDDADHDDQLDRAWWDLSSHSGTLDSAGTVLLSVEGAGGLPWLQAQVSRKPPRASAIGLPGHDIGFVALSVDGEASIRVTSEEWETWIFSNPPP